MKLPKINIFLILCIAGTAVFLLVLGLFLAAFDSTPESIPAVLESEYIIEESETAKPAKKRRHVPACRYDLAQLICEDNVFRYEEDGVVTSAFGIDVSSHQTDIDWKAVKESGVSFAFIRAGFRGYESGKLVKDELFHQNMQGALDAGLDVGVYFFSQAISPDEAVKEAELTLSMLEDYEITYPVVFDWEFVSGSPARTDNISTEMLTECTIAFCDTIKAAGYTPMFYQNKDTALMKMELELLTDYDFWLAEYGDLPTYHFHYDMWQYTAKGSIPGIEGNVDLNICFTDYGSEEN